MKHIQTAFKSLGAIALVVLAVSCASEFKSRQSLAVAAGFKVITPTKPDQAAILSQLPEDKVSPITYEGKHYYVLPDVKNNQAYVGGPSQYQTYRQLRHEKEVSDKMLEAAQMTQMSQINQLNAMNWGAWGGWRGVGRGGWY